jgi:hypothetical protein
MKIEQRIILKFLVRLKNKRCRKEEMTYALEDTSSLRIRKAGMNESGVNTVILLSSTTKE